MLNIIVRDILAYGLIYINIKEWSKKLKEAARAALSRLSAISKLD